MSDDTMATSRAIDALKDPALQDFADKLVDRVSAIVGNHQLRVIEALAQLEANQTAFSHPLGALVAKQDLITEHLVRQDTALGGLKEGQAALRSEFQETSESLSQWRAEVDATLEDFRQSREQSIEERAELRADLEKSKADRMALHADLEESKADRKAIRAEQQAHNEAMTAKLNELSAAIEELRKGVNGRLSQLIKASESVAHTEGRDEERAHPGVE